ncbi:MAG TPA: class II glutamine amidotransferase, partial [Gaiellaceae bacterium]|nr:class II glutamine amidotransferase [Gaiellaceae bacterium]
MCRWLAYYGKPVLMDKVLYGPQHSLIEQSLESRLGAEPTNGDGFGIGWYGPQGPGVFKSMEPAWNDRNLREISGHVESHLFLAHIRATSGTAVQQTNCHPFRHGKWLWVHNGLVHDWLRVKRDLVLAVDPDLFPFIEGSADSEVLFFLALTLGLEDDPPGAVARTIGLVEEIGHAHDVRFPFQGTIAATNGERLWAFRYSSEGRSRSLFFSTAYETLQALYPDDPRLADFDQETRLVVSEPLGEVPGVWNEMPES